MEISACEVSDRVSISLSDALLAEEDSEHEMVTPIRYKAACCIFYSQWFLLTVVPLSYADHLNHCNEFVKEIYHSHVAIAVVIVAGFAFEIALIPSGKKISVCAMILATLSKLDFYTNVLFVCIANDCQTMLWLPSCVLLGSFLVLQLIVHGILSVTDQDGRLPDSHGVIWFDLKMLNYTLYPSYVPILPFLFSEHTFSSVSQVFIQLNFLQQERQNEKVANPTVYVSLCIALLHVLASTLNFAWWTMHKPEDEEVQPVSVDNPGHGRLILGKKKEKTVARKSRAHRPL